MNDFKVTVVIATEGPGLDVTREVWIMAEEQSDAWAQGLEIATDGAALQDGAIKSLSVERTS